MLNFLVETFILGVKNLRLHKLRSLLTALGIIFGVAAVIIMVAIGEGTKQSALEQLRQLGATNILVRSIEPPESSDASSHQQREYRHSGRSRCPDKTRPGRHGANGPNGDECDQRRPRRDGHDRKATRFHRRTSRNSLVLELAVGPEQLRGRDGDQGQRYRGGGKQAQSAAVEPDDHGPGDQECHHGAA